MPSILQLHPLSYTHISEVMFMGGTTITPVSATEFTTSQGSITIRFSGRGLTYDGMGRVTGGQVDELRVYDGALTVENQLVVVDSNFVLLTDVELRQAFHLYDTVSAGVAANYVIRSWTSEFFWHTNYTGGEMRGYGNYEALYGGIGEDTIRGYDGDDSILLSSGTDVAYGGAGNDHIYHYSGDAVIFGGLGQDYVTAGEGNDSLYGGAANDNLRGEAGEDLLKGGDGDDYLDGGKGRDDLSGSLGNDTLDGGQDADTLRGALGDDSLIGGSGDDVLLGGVGNDTANGEGGNDWLEGHSGDDSLSGTAGNDSLFGGTGNDHLRGGTDNDWLKGGADNDLLQGEDGADTLDGGAGSDTMTGGMGVDTFVFQRGYGADRINDFTVDEDILALSEALLGRWNDSTRTVLNAYTYELSNGILFTFGNGDTLFVHGITERYDLLDSILII